MNADEVTAMWVPFGTSLLEHHGVAFIEEVRGDETYRTRLHPPKRGEVVSFKDEDGKGRTRWGPVWIDDAPLAEVEMDGHWFACWYSRAEARQMAKALGTELVES